MHGLGLVGCRTGARVIRRVGGDVGTVVADARADLGRVERISVAVSRISDGRQARERQGLWVEQHGQGAGEADALRADPAGVSVDLDAFAAVTGDRICGIYG